MNNKTILLTIISLLMLAQTALATEYHVSPDGNDANPGTAAAPFRTIQHAADLAQPGDVVTAHSGVYRERIDPPRGGESDARRIVYQAAPGAKVEIKGSEVVTGWVKVKENIWKVTLPNTFFGSFNPYQDLIHGDWFVDNHRPNHTGTVYLHGEWLTEAARLKDVTKYLKPAPLWFARVDDKNTTIWAQFKKVNPNEQQVEINVRRTVFYPAKEGINYITVRGFTMSDAATPWAPPTAEQIGLIGTHWSKGWIIENNVISHSICSGIALGKYGDEWDNKSPSTNAYNRTIQRALAHGWSKENIGSHIVRNNTIFECGQAGIVGSLGAVFSTITGNTIHDIHIRRQFGGFEMAAIKIHGAIDVQISKNHIYRNCMGIWLDWMAQGARVSSNLMHDNSGGDMFIEVDHGPFLVDNNIFFSQPSVVCNSNGGAFVHNLFAGGCPLFDYDARTTPFMKAHSTQIVGLHDNPSGDMRFYNNVLIRKGNLSQYDKAMGPVWMEGNVFFKGTHPSKSEKDPLLLPTFNPGVRLVEKSDGIYLKMALPADWAGQVRRKLVTTELLGIVAIPRLPFENPDGSPLRVDTDFFGKNRNSVNPTPGPFEDVGSGVMQIKVMQSKVDQ